MEETGRSGETCFATEPKGRLQRRFNKGFARSWMKEVTMGGRAGWKFMVLIAVTVALAAICFAAGCGGEAGREDLGASKGVTLEEGGEVTSQEVAFPGEASNRGVSAGEDRKSTAPAGGSALPQLQLKVIKTAQVDLEVEKGGYADLREDAVAAASAAGGYVQGESSGKDDEGLTHATLILRVPADSFDRVMQEISRLGEVVSSQVNTTDVSEEYVDLEARLRHLQAEEDFYLSLIGKATSVQEMISIREHLSGVQLEKEQVKGRMNFLDQQVAYSTLTLSVDERGEDGDKGFWNSVGRAFRSFARGLRALVLGLFYALPWAVLVLLVVLVSYFLVRRRKGKESQQSGN